MPLAPCALRSRGLPVLLLLWASAASAIDFPNMKEDRVEVVGMRADGQAWALRRTSTFRGREDGARGSVCGYPGTKAVAVVDAVDLVVCARGRPCEAPWPIYTLPRQDRRPDAGRDETALDRGLCTPPATARVRLADAKEALSARGITLRDDAAVALTPVRDHVSPVPRLALPADAPAAAGLPGPALLWVADDAEGWLVLHVEAGGVRAPVAKLPWWNTGVFATQGFWLPSAGVVLVFFIAPMNAEALIPFAEHSAFDAQPLELSAHVLASRAFNQRGLVAHRKGDFAAAARDFSASASADATFGQAHFNLACALSREGQAGPALAALEAALGVDRATFWAKAQRDADLAALRQAPGFRALAKAKDGGR